VGRTCGKHG